MSKLSQGYIRRKGRTDGATIGAGLVGELLSSVVASASAVTLTNGIWTPISTILLSAGVWDIQVSGILRPDATTTFTALGANSSPVSGGNSLIQGGLIRGAAHTPGNVKDVVVVGRRFVTVTSETTYYFNMLCDFSVGTAKGYGAIYAARRATA